MREDNNDSNWFSKWEDEELPSPDELMPLSQTLITPDLALAFNIRSSAAISGAATAGNHRFRLSSQPNSSELDCEVGGGGGGDGGGSGGGAVSVGGEEPARTLKRPRLVWTPQLHKRFVDAVAHLGIKNAVPKTIMQLMSVDGLTRENVASHLQKYRLYLKRMQGLNNGGGGPGGGSGGGRGGGSGDPASDRLFASSPARAHFLHQAGAGGGGSVGRPSSDHFTPYMPVAAALHHQQMVAATAGQYRQMGHFGSSQGGGQFDNPFLSRLIHLGPNINGMVQNSGYVEDVESKTANKGRKALTLFPTGDD